MIVGLVSTYNENRLGKMAVESLLPAVDKVLIAEGPIGEGQIQDGDLVEDWDEGEWRPPYPNQNKSLEIYTGKWDSDAEKRNLLLSAAHMFRADWIVWLDGDEILLHGQYLHDYIARAEHGDEDLKVTGGFPLRLVEMDGTVVQAMGRVLRADRIVRYVHSIVEVVVRDETNVQLETHISLPNVPNWRPAYEKEGIAGSYQVPAEPITGLCRPPLQGEPHILHRSPLRDPSRQAERQSEAEVRGYREQAARMGLVLPE